MTGLAGFLLIPEPGDPTTARLWRKVRLVGARTLLSWPAGGLAPPMARGLLQLQAALVPALRATPDAVLRAVGSPDVLTALLVGHGGLRPAETLLSDLVPHLLFQLGRSGAFRHLGESVLWEWPVARLIDQAGGADRGGDGVVVTLPAPAAGLFASPSGVEIALADGRHVDVREAAADPSPSLVGICDDLPAQLALVDTNPLSMDEAHPDKQGNAVSLGDRALEAWRASLTGALELVRTALPALFAELGTSLARVVPVGYEPEKHLSASYREAPGVIYATLHPSALTMAEALIHETQHGKLNVLGWLDPVLENGRSEWAKSPVRPDSRPLSGVLLAVHAFAPVAALHARLAALGHPVAATPEFARRRAEVLRSNADALDTLGRLARPTAVGRRVLDAIVRLDQATRSGMAGVVEGRPG